MARIFTALEEVSDTGINDTLEQTILEQEFSAQDLNEEVQQSKEAIETSEVLEKMNNASSSDEASIIATEYLLSKIGYSKKYSLESFNNDLVTTLGVAQEGFFSRIGNAFGRIFTTNKSFNKRLQKSVAKLEANGNKEDILRDPSWSKHLIANSNKVIKSSDVVDYLRKVDSLVGDKELNKLFLEIATVYDKMATELLENSYVVDRQIITNVSSIYKESQELLQRFEVFARSRSTPKQVDNYPDYEPIKYEQAKSIRDIILKGFISNDVHSPEYRTFQRAAKNLNSVMENKGIAFVKAVMKSTSAVDTKISHNVTARVNESLQCITSAISLRTKIAYAALRYIEVSSK